MDDIINAATEKVRLVRTICGEYLLGLVAANSPSDGKTRLKSVRKLSMAMTMDGGVSVGLVPICPFTTKKFEDVELSDATVMFSVDEDDMQKELVTSYRSEISGISLVSNGPGVIV